VAKGGKKGEREAPSFRASERQKFESQRKKRKGKTCRFLRGKEEGGGRNPQKRALFNSQRREKFANRVLRGKRRSCRERGFGYLSKGRKKPSPPRP